MRFQCTQCKSVVTVDAESMGQAVACGVCGRYAMAPPTRLSPGAVIGPDFVIEKELARGGMGTVYLAQQMSLDRPVALKILHRWFSDDPAYTKDFLREARAAAQLNHPGIVQAYAVGEDEGIHFFAMEFVRGTTLKQILTHSERMVPERALAILKAVSEALEYAWSSQQLVHRDIKPDNIMVTEKGEVKLADLGLAKKATDMLEAVSEEVAGTPHYMSPEQILQRPLNFRSDMYSLGATFYKALTGVFPFTGPSPAAIAMKHLGQLLVPAEDRAADLPPPVAALLDVMMSKRPEHRHASYPELLKDIVLVAAGVFPQHPVHPDSQMPLPESGVTDVPPLSTTRTKRRALVRSAPRSPTASSPRIKTDHLGAPASSPRVKTDHLGSAPASSPRVKTAHLGLPPGVPHGSGTDRHTIKPRPLRRWLAIGLAVAAGLLLAVGVAVGGRWLHWQSLSTAEKEMARLRRKYPERQMAAYEALLKMPAQNKGLREILGRVKAYCLAFPTADELAAKVEALAAPYIEEEIGALRRERRQQQLDKWHDLTKALIQRRAAKLAQQHQAEVEENVRQAAEEKRRLDERLRAQANQEQEEKRKAEEAQRQAAWTDFTARLPALRLEFVKRCRANQFAAARESIADLEKSVHPGVRDWMEAKTLTALLADQARNLVLDGAKLLKGVEFAPDPKHPGAKVALTGIADTNLLVAEQKVVNEQTGARITINHVLKFDDLPLPVRLALLDRAVEKTLVAGVDKLDANLLGGAWLLACAWFDLKAPGPEKDSFVSECRRRLEAAPKDPDREKLLAELRALEELDQSTPGTFTAVPKKPGMEDAVGRVTDPPAGSVARPAVTPALEVVLHWKFEGNLNDVSGKERHGIAAGGKPKFKYGRFGQGLACEGPEMAISSPVPSLSAFTVAFWFKPAPLASARNVIGSGWGSFLFHTTEKGGVMVGTDENTRMTESDLGPGTVVADKWQFLAFSFENGTGKFYRNSTLLKTKTGMSPPGPWKPFGFTCGTGEFAVKGMLDDVRLYAGALADRDLDLCRSGMAPTLVKPRTGSSDPGVPDKRPGVAASPGGQGLTATYFDNVELTGPAKLTRIDAIVNFVWDGGSPPGPGLPSENFSARWSGFVQPKYSEAYTFSTCTDDGVRLWVNGQLLVDDWNGHAATERTGTLDLVAGRKYSLKMEYFQGGGGASAALSWTSPSQAKEIIPPARLFPGP